MGQRRIPDDEVIEAVASLHREAGRVTIRDLARRVGLSPNATWVRTNHLVDDGRLTHEPGRHGTLRLPDHRVDGLEVVIHIDGGRATIISSRAL